MSITIQGTYTLPSKGLIYSKPINPEVTLRSMTTMDELKRLQPNDNEQRVMCNLINDCIVGDLGIDAYDLCMGDYNYLLHRLRVLSHGPEYKMVTRCPKCQTIEEQTFNLDTLEVNEYEDGMLDLLNVHLPKSDVDVKLRFTTSRMIDEVEKRRKDILKQTPDALDPRYLVTLEYLIESVDGKVLSYVDKEKFVQNLPIKDANLIINRVAEFNKKIGLDITFTNECPVCKYVYLVPFQFGAEFFGPTN